MVGKPNIPSDYHQKLVRGSAEHDPVYDALDQERAASMTDEGGAAATNENILRQRHAKHGGLNWNWKSKSLTYMGAAFTVGVALAFLKSRTA